MRGALTVSRPTAFKRDPILTEERPISAPTSQSTRSVTLPSPFQRVTPTYHAFIAYICYNLSKFATMSYVRYALIRLLLID
jgi:hypothetical protein